MSSVLTKYETAKAYLASAITDTAGYENVTIAYGDVVGKIEVPSAYIKLAEPLVTRDDDDYSSPYWSVFTINLGIKVLYDDESGFLTSLEPLVAAINSSGTGICGVEVMYVAGLEWGSENKQYSWATISVEVRCTHD